MSIIYDALKKIQKYNSENLDVNTGLKKNYPKHRVYFFYFLIVCMGLFIGNIFFNFLGRPRHPALKQAKEGLVEENTSSSIEEPPPQKEVVVFTAPAKKIQQSLVLNGIFFSQDEGYALINNKIVKEGELLEGGKVTKITLDTVELEYEGSKITLDTGK